MNQKEKNQLIAEFRILKSLVHPHIVQYYHHEHVPEEHAVHLYMEYCGGGDLAGVIRKCKSTGEYVSENMIWSVFTQLTLALYRCHYNSDPPSPGELFSTTNSPTPPQPATVILHRDIKPENVFLDQYHCVKLGDFGLAKILDHEHYMANTYVGTPYYMSPEVLLDKPFTPQSDVWSVGCVIYELCAKHPPFQAKTHIQLSQKIREGKYPPLPSIYSATLSKTIAACLNMNYLQRPTTSTLLRLDVMKLCRKEREVEGAKRNVQQLENKLIQERENMKKQLQIQQEQMAQKIAEEFKTHVEQEVERRVSAILQEQTLNALNQNQNKGPPASPALSGHQWRPSSPDKYQQLSGDTTMASAHNTQVTPSRNVKGPRTIREQSVSPVSSRSPMKPNYQDKIEPPDFNAPPPPRRRLSSSKKHTSSHSLNDATSTVTKHKAFNKSVNTAKYGSRPNSGDYGPRFTYNNAKYANEDSATSSIASVSTFSSQSSQFSSASDCSHGSYDMEDSDYKTYKSNSGMPRDTSESPRATPRERQAPHFQAIYEVKQTVVNGVGAQAAMAKVMGVKGPAMGRRVVHIQPQSPQPMQHNIWDNSIHPDEMSNPFQKRQERNRH